jgi:DNA polymerase III gamma/tau subunit
VFLRAEGSSAPPANIDRAKEIEAMAERIPVTKAHQIVSQLETALAQLESNVNPRLLAEVILLDWPKV